MVRVPGILSTSVTDVDAAETFKKALLSVLAYLSAAAFGGASKRYQDIGACALRLCLWVSRH